MRILIVGGPKVGKTTLAKTLFPKKGVIVRHGDSLISTHEWSAASEEISKWFDYAGHWVIEGVQVVRALRKWFKSHETGKPCDHIYYLHRPLVKLSKAQEAMARGHESVWKEIWPEINMRKIPVTSVDCEWEIADVYMNTDGKLSFVKCGPSNGKKDLPVPSSVMIVD